MAQLQIDNLTKHFGTTVAVHPTSYQFKDGSLTVLVGPSGCGKTTLLRMIVGLTSPTGGSICIDGERIDERPTWNRDVAMVFQNYALYPHMTVAQNIGFPLVARGLKPNDRLQRTVEVAKQLQIAHLLERKPRQLSGGQQQRVALGRAIVRRPKVFLMDEPLSNLDAALRTDTRTEIKHLQRQLGITTLYVTHDQVEAMTLADDLIIINEGRIQQTGSPTSIYQAPANIFVARFLGDPPTNIISTEHDAISGILVNRFSQLDRKINIEQVKFLGIRPEIIRITEAENAFMQGQVYAIEPLGRETIITVAIKDDTLKLITSSNISYSIGSLVHLTFNLADAILFDASGKNLNM